jgi:energy-coupling factor transporter ATP-binding protein EcfA2
MSSNGTGLSKTVPAAIAAHDWGWRHASRLAWAVRGLDLAIRPGERVLVLGASGAGKSTLVRALAGVLAPDEGEQEGSLLIDGQPPIAGRGRAGLVLQDPDSQVILQRVGDDIAFGCENLGVPRDEIWRRVHVALDAVGLDVPLETPTNVLSGGQKQRLALAGVIAMQPGLVLLDEPTANLDPTGVIEVRDAVSRSIAATGATLVVIEHRVAVWLPVVDRVIVISPAGVVADGSPDEVLRARGAELAAAGVWVPGFPPPAPLRTSRAASEALVNARDLSVGRDGSAIREGLSFDVSSASTTVTTGPNGSGKTTLALTLGGLLQPIGGELRATSALAAGASLSPIMWRSTELLTRIGTVFQSPEHQFVASTVRAELAVGPRALRLDKAAQSQRVDELLARLRLDALADANPFTLSGGEQRRLSVATALATRPRILVLDEPTFGQDSLTWAELVQLLAELVDAGSSVVAATHDAEFVAVAADFTVDLS